MNESKHPDINREVSLMEKEICNLQYIQDDCDREGSTRMMANLSRNKLASLKFERALILSRASKSISEYNSFGRGMHE